MLVRTYMKGVKDAKSSRGLVDNNENKRNDNNREAFAHTY